MFKKIIVKIKIMLNKMNFGGFGNSDLQKPLLIYNKKNIIIGNGVTIREGLRAEPIKKYMNQAFNPILEIGDNTNIEQYCHITCAGHLKIGKEVTIAGFSMITDIDHEYRNIEIGILNQKLIVKKTEIGDQCFIGMGARIMAGTVLGKHVIVGTNSVVKGTIPDYCVVAGIPAKIVKRYNVNSCIWQKTNEKGEFIENE